MSENDKKILGILPHSIGGRLTISSVFDGFKQNGYDVEIFDELKQENFLDFIKDKTYKFLVGYDFSGLKLKVDNNLNIKTVNYFSDVIENKTSGVQDEWEKYLPYLSEEGNYTFYWDRELAEQSKIKNLYYMPHFVNMEIYKDLGLKKEYDVMFAGRLDTEERLNFFVDLMKEFPNLNFAWYAIEKHYQDALLRTEEKELLKNAYKGFIDNEQDMAIALNKSKIVYNINAQGLTSLNYRTIQTLACRTLMISDFRAEVGLMKGYMPYYVDFEDLVSKIKYFLNNDLAMQSALNHCYEIVHNNHNSKNCVMGMLKVMGNLSD